MKNSSLILYGKHACLAALNNPKRVCKKILTTTNFLKNNPEISKFHNVQTVKPIDIEKLLPKNSVHQGILVYAEPLENNSIEDVCNLSPLAILDQVTDPQNFGAIMRSAAAFDIKAIITTKDHAPKESASLAKTACGALESIPIIKVTNLTNTIKTLQKNGHWIIALDSNSNKNLNNIKTDGKTTIVLGAEGKGLRRLTLESCDYKAKLPISNNMESLNVSNAAAIAFYQLYVNNN